MTYDNTLRLTVAGMPIARPPRGKHRRLWDRLRGDIPTLDGSRVHTDFGGMLQVEIERTMGTPGQRRARIAAAAEHLSGEVRSMADNGQPRSVTHWIAMRIDDIWVIVSTKICECHDGLEHTLGVFPDQDDVIAAAVGKALREIVPAEDYPLIGQAEALLDAAQAIRGAQ